jgi:hypothetical protein
MKLIEILEKVNECNTVKVFSATNALLLSEYNGKDSIDPTYNGNEVTFINAVNDTLEIYVKED